MSLVFNLNIIYFHSNNKIQMEKILIVSVFLTTEENCLRNHYHKHKLNQITSKAKAKIAIFYRFYNGEHRKTDDMAYMFK